MRSHCVDGNFLEVIQRQSKGFRCGLEFPAHRGITHQPVIGVESYPKFLLIKNLEGMFRQAGVAPV